MLNFFFRKRMLSGSIKATERIVFFNILALPFWYFSLLSILGMSHFGEQESPLYWVLVIFSSIMAYTFIALRIFINGHIRLSLLPLYLLPVAIIVIYLWTGNFTGLAFQSIALFLVFVAPAFYVGIELGSKGSIEEYSQTLFGLGLLVSVGVLATIPVVLNTDLNILFEVFAGGHYQALSYFASLAFVIILVHLFAINGNKSGLMILMLVLLLIGDLAVIFFSGGRGGLVVITFGILAVMVLKLTVRKFLTITLTIVLSLYLMVTLLQNVDFLFKDRVMESSMRLISYIVDGGIDFSTASNRDIFYGQAIEYISQRPIFGYGLFGVIDQSPDPYFGSPGLYYPHNLFLEVLLHGGLIYLAVFLTIFIWFGYKFYRMIACDVSQILLLPFFSYSFVQLMFSGTYLQETLFWFVFAYVMAYPSREFHIKNRQ